MLHYTVFDVAAASENSFPLIVLAGPTGAGKSEAALAVAESWPAEIVNCDSLQVYRYFDIGTAKLRPDERRGIPHHLIDLLNPDQVFTAGDYARRARPILRSIARSGRVPVIAGGTGFYLRALLEGLFPGPPRDEALRDRLASREQRYPGLLHRFLSRWDPLAAARIHPHDTVKLIRAVEVCLLGDEPLTDQFRRGREALAGFRTLKLILDPPRQALYEKLNRRAAWMFRTGLLDEVRAIQARGFTPECKPFESLGYRQAIEHLSGELSLEDAIESTQQETRRYAKRQGTWFRREPEAVWITGFGTDPEALAGIRDRVSEFLRRFRMKCQGHPCAFGDP